MDPATATVESLFTAASLGNLQGNLLVYMGGFLALSLCFLGYGKIRTLIRRG